MTTATNTVPTPAANEPGCTPINPTFARLHRELRSAKAARSRTVTAWSWLIRAVLLVVLLGGWELLVRTGLVNPAIIGTPGQVLDYLVATVPTQELWINAWSTTQATIVGLVAGSTAGIVAGIVLFEVEPLRRGFSPYITFLNSLPRPALAPIFLLWFGLGMGAKVSVSISIVVFVLLLNTLAGLQGANGDHLFLSQSLGMSRLQRLRLIQLPSALPVIMAGLRLATVYSVLGVVVSELVASDRGLGQMLVIETNSFNVAGAFGILVILGLLSMSLNAIVSVIERRFDWGQE